MLFTTEHQQYDLWLYVSTSKLTVENVVAVNLDL